MAKMDIVSNRYRPRVFGHCSTPVIADLQLLVRVKNSPTMPESDDRADPTKDYLSALHAPMFNTHIFYTT